MTSPAAITATLFIRSLQVFVHLGWSDEEREEAQVIMLDVDITFATPPKACVSDHLDDAVCYAHLIDKIKTHCATQSFHLIEHLGHAIYQLLKKNLPDDCTLQVRIVKHPPLEGLTQGVCFAYGDKN